MSFNMQILIPLDNMQPKILTILHPAKNLSYVILPFGDAHARAYQEKIDFSMCLNYLFTFTPSLSLTHPLP
jgi:hypothetical protein